MTKNKKLVTTFAGAAIICDQQVSCANLSPENWDQELRARAEKRQATGWSPDNTCTISGKNGIIAASCSPLAVQAGIVTLQQGGNAADAAATVALTQITTELGSVVSFAGILSLIYYDAGTRKTISMDAGYNSYLHETDPLSIPVNDWGPLNKPGQDTTGSAADHTRTPQTDEKKGRETLVPGFMAGIESMHQRFGSLPFADLFQPAIWYADHGTTINSTLSSYFEMHQKYLSRTQEGQEFLRQAGNELPKEGDLFFQPQLARVLRGVAQHGSQYMYRGPWARHFVKLVRREGGKVTLKDMSRYKVIWSEPFCTTYLGHKIYIAGKPNESAYHILTALHLAEQLRLEQRQDYWKDALVLRDLQRIFDLSDLAPWIDPALDEILKSKGIDTSADAQLNKAFAEAIAPLFDQIYVKSPLEPRHSNSMVVIDKSGNIAAITHTINTVIWGDSGIVVSGIPIPDSAGFQQQRLALIKQGDRVPHEMPQTIVFKDDKPVLVTAAIGSSMLQETVRIILGIIGKQHDLSTLQAAPPLIFDFTQIETGMPLSARGVAVPERAYDDVFVNRLRDLCGKVNLLPKATTSVLRGTVTAATIDFGTGERRGAETPDVLVFCEAY